jgi:hypothetical protein
MCNQVYVGQTGRNFRIRYEEHINNIRSNRDQSRYALHILQQNHEYGTIDQTMKVLKLANKSKYLNTMEKLYIYKTTKCKEILNEQHVCDSNVLLDLALKYDETD